MDGKSIQPEWSFPPASSTEAVNGLKCSECGSSDFIVENQEDSGRKSVAILSQHAILCHSCLANASNARDGKNICDLPPQVLEQIFQNFNPSFWFDTLRSVCTLWCTIVDRLCKSFQSIFCFPDNVCLELFRSNPAFYDISCTSIALCHFIESSALRLKKFVIWSDLWNQVEIIHSLKKCSNLSDLMLSYNFEPNLKQVKELCFPNLQTLLLELCPKSYRNDNEALINHAKIACEVLANFFSKSKQISGLSFAIFTSHFNLLPLMRHLKLKALELYAGPIVTNDVLQRGLELAEQQAQSLESLVFALPYTESLEPAKFLNCMLKLCEANKLISFVWSCNCIKLLSALWSEVTIFGLAKLSSLKKLALKNIDFTFRPSLQQNGRTANLLLAPIFQSLIYLCLDRCVCNEAFLQKAFSSRLPNLKILKISTTEDISNNIICCVVGQWCPNLEKLDLQLKVRNEDIAINWMWSKELLTEVHEVVHSHSCRAKCSGVLDSHSLKRLSIEVGMKFPLENFEEWGLCGARLSRKFASVDILISRNCCL